ncbi:hypothetical protein CY34DRAFT_607689 [Suillus luteus UH-Slu-Lm8-n1]|uniref:Uncharacterized protein n=1 Tax=Suillus luteus UH-Slu-Lm8-n1 TaxID=930992 RepID=A0A0D0ASN7_9AGAM|nr:hypothetical protein CY34DRAFT_607689 [Suillus luteus UH-Slu-Lm8-n1]
MHYGMSMQSGTKAVQELEVTYAESQLARQHHRPNPLPENSERTTRKSLVCGFRVMGSFTQAADERS